MDGDLYDGIPIGELPLDEVDWTHRGDYIRTRSQRKDANEFDVDPEWATEAVMDSRAVIRRDRLLVVILIPKDHPPTGPWWGANAWSANERDRRDYEETR